MKTIPLSLFIVLSFLLGVVVGERIPQMSDRPLLKEKETVDFAVMTVNVSDKIGRAAMATKGVPKKPCSCD